MTVSQASLLIYAIFLFSWVHFIPFLLLGLLKINGIEAADVEIRGNPPVSTIQNVTKSALSILRSLPKNYTVNDITTFESMVEQLKYKIDYMSQFADLDEERKKLEEVRVLLDNVKTRLKELNMTLGEAKALIRERKQNKVDASESDYCKAEGSLNEIAFKMISYSSPKGSSSFKKLKRILDEASFFHVDLGNPIFENVEVNLATMLKGFGLKHEQRPIWQQDIIHIERVRLDSVECTGTPRIVVQTERLEYLGRWYLRSLQECHVAENCVIFDFSDYNYRWITQYRMQDSVVLLPVMIQSRLTHGLQQQQQQVPMKPLQERNLDVVFFCYMLERRNRLRREISSTIKKWRFIFEDNNRTDYMVAAYREARVCLVVHAYNAESGGEYHRLSEFATMGCVPVMESFADTIAIDDYARCGGVVFTDYHNLIPTVTQVLQEISASKRDTSKYVEWWKQGVDWEGVLVRMFQEEEGGRIAT